MTCIAACSPASLSPLHPPPWTGQQADRLDGAKQGYRANDLRKCLQDIVFAYTYPRLDAEVTKKMNHLLKVCVGVCGSVCVIESVSGGWVGVLKAGAVFCLVLE
jgi:hypothetical protein